MIQIECPESLNQLMKNYIELNTKNEQMTKNSHYDNEKGLRLELKIDKDSPCLTFVITPYESVNEVEVFYINHIIKQLSNIYSRLINHYKFRYQTVFSVVSDKQNEIFIDLNISHNLTQNDIDMIDIISPLKHKIHDEEMKNSSLQINSLTVYFYKDSKIIFDVETIDQRCSLQSMFEYINSGEI